MKKTISISAAICLVVIVAILLVLFLFFATHTVYPDFIEEYTLEQEYYDTYGDDGYCYFFVQSDEHYCFNGTGLEELQLYAPQYDTAEIDTENYNYIVAINCEINSISYSCKTAYKTMSVGIDTYVADADLTKTNDYTVRIYKMKKLNIDYDYKKYGPIATNFEI